ncbi:transitional endoplasmic reticulum ATPase [Methanococcus voltae]|uniref:CDC48 family AAA ATPase n=1 Tax=Methanococcus voltae TaxID=2188 RepID=UPI001AE65534|nr:CDC48 family AAA ATPase [Methanococcus voltae]MBP2144354.1 transitional endoplasmic reticulum ATPase [Methanococcus voltae]
MVELIVEEAYQSDVGKSTVRIDPVTMQKLSLEPGDVIQIEGKDKTYATVLRGYLDDQNTKTIRMDGLLRQVTKAGIGDKVTVEKVQAKEAKKIVLAPSRPVRFNAGFEDYVKSRLDKQVVGKGSNVLVAVLGTAFQFVVVNTSPKSPVIIGPATTVELKTEPAGEIKETKVPSVSYEDIGGLREEVKKIREMVELPMRHPELFDRLGIEPPKGVLLAGPPGTGKTLLAKAVANESGANYYTINGPEIMSKYVGETEENLRKIFEEAEENAPSVIFIDEIDAVAPKRDEVTGEVERRMVAQLLTLLDGLENRGQVVILAATNRPDSIDIALRRPGRLDRELTIGIPDRNARREILDIHTRSMPLEADYDELSLKDGINYLANANRKDVDARDKARKLKEMLTSSHDSKVVVEKARELGIIDKIDSAIIKSFVRELADKTHGFAGADLSVLCKEAAMKSLRKLLDNKTIDLDEEIPKEVLETLKVTKGDFYDALKEVEPSTLREVLVDVPNIKWSDIGGLEDVKQELIEAVEWPLKYPDRFIKMGIRPPKGILLFGPPGTGKTLLAKAVANESEANFISVKGPEIFSKWVGDSEKAIREIFKKARQASPTVIFFDEIDSIAPVRGMSFGNDAAEKVVNQLLTELDGLEEPKDLVIIAATNRPKLIDPALLRPGRIDRMVLVPAPDSDTRLKIFKVHTANMPILDNNKEEIDKLLVELSEKTAGYSGADIAGICREAAMITLRENLDAQTIPKESFLKAMRKVKASISKEDEEENKKLVEEFNNQ